MCKGTTQWLHYFTEESVLITCEKPWMYAPQPVIESKDVKILWDFDRSCHLSRRPNIIVLDYQKKCDLF